MTHADIPTIEVALHGLLSAIVAKEALDGTGRHSGPRIAIVPTPWKASPIPSRASSAIIAMSRDPVGAACRQGIRLCGERLFELTQDAETMREVLDRLADRDPSNAGRRASIVDAAWNGIGGVWFS